MADDPDSFNAREALVYHETVRPGNIEIIASNPMATRRFVSKEPYVAVARTRRAIGTRASTAGAASSSWFARRCDAPHTESDGRASARAVVTIRETANQVGNKYECEVILHLPGEIITVKDATMNKFAAVDIVEAKLHNRLLKYKTTHSSAARRGLLRRVRERLFLSSTESDA